jgi:predicted ribosome quality control (RQC) complex YloA/Tae2 family protein
MPLDGAFLNCLRNELSLAVDCHIDKIHMPDKNEFVFSLRGKGKNFKLYISINPEAPRLSFTEQSFDNPNSPPMLCMLLRKHLCSGRVVSVEGLGSERVVVFNIIATNEMGDRVNYRLITELTGHKTNLILVNNDGKVVDCARRSDIESGGRLVVPGAFYTPPETDGRVDFLEGDLAFAIEEILSRNIPLAESILKSIAGISPLICREITLEATGDCNAFCGEATTQGLLQTLEKFVSIAKGQGIAYMLMKEDGTPKDFSFVPIKQYGKLFTLKAFNSFSELLESFYREKEHSRRINSAKSDLLRLVKNLIARNEKKLNLRKSELKKSENREELRVFGELIKANIYQIEKGASSITVQNYYDPKCAEIKIPLNNALSPAANAAKYFKEYKKACTASQTLGKLIEDCVTETEYLQSVLFSLESAETTAELGQIREELCSNGYIAKRKGASKPQKGAKPMEFKKDGFKILVGRNNLQNDQLTLKTASKTDLWFHTKNIHGSHVILFTERKTPSDKVFIFPLVLPQNILRP